MEKREQTYQRNLSSSSIATSIETWLRVKFHDSYFRWLPFPVPDDLLFVTYAKEKNPEKRARRRLFITIHTFLYSIESLCQLCDTIGYNATSCLDAKNFCHLSRNRSYRSSNCATIEIAARAKRITMLLRFKEALFIPVVILINGWITMMRGCNVMQFAKLKQRGHNGYFIYFSFPYGATTSSSSPSSRNESSISHRGDNRIIA